MEVEKRLSEYIFETSFDDLPREPVNVIKDVILTVFGTTIAGARAQGCQAMVEQVRTWGGRKESTILIHGGKVPAYNAALVNSFMARALDFCDAMVPGLHVGSSSVPTALATAELVGRCSGKEFLCAIVVGTETAARLNLSEEAYNGFDPTGVCTIFATSVIAGKILHLNPTEMVNALGIAFNRAGGSFQSNIDGSLAVRLIQGFVSQGGLISAQLAQKGITGPKNFLEGIYGYFHLFGKDKFDPYKVLEGLGNNFELTKTVFKKYPSCGGTLSSTDAILDLIKEDGLSPEDVTRINIRVTPYIYKLVGHPFKIGENPKVDAQFSIQYCVANALLRRDSRLWHFDEIAIRDPKIMELVNRIHVISDPTLDQRGHTSIDMEVIKKDKSILRKSVDIARGFPGNPLTQEEHLHRFYDCLDYGGNPLSKEKAKKLISLIGKLEDLEDVNIFIPFLLPQGVKNNG